MADKLGSACVFIIDTFFRAASIFFLLANNEGDFKIFASRGSILKKYHSEFLKIFCHLAR